MKKRYLFVMVEGGGNVPAQLSVVRRLASRGHEVHVLGCEPIRAEAEQVGARFSAFERAPHQNMRDRGADLVKDWEPKTPIGQFARIAEKLFFGPAELYARDVLDAVERVRPDALGVDFLCVGAMVGAEKSGVPSAALVHMPYSVPVEGVTPMGMGFQPASGPLGRLRDRFVRWLLFRNFDAGLPKLNATREALGLTRLATVFDQFLAFPRTLVLSSASFDFVPPSPPPGVVWVGAQLDDPGWVEPWRSPWPDDTREPLVLVSLGSTFQDQGPTLRRVADALGSLPVRAVVTLAGQFEASELPRHDHVHYARSAPHAAILPRAELVICHGGHGTVMKALSHGVPVVCVPFGRDQKDNGARLVRAGAGVVTGPGTSSAGLAKLVTRALSDTSLREGAARMQRAIAEDTARDLAVSELEALAR